MSQVRTHMSKLIKMYLLNVYNILSLSYPNKAKKNKAKKKKWREEGYDRQRDCHGHSSERVGQRHSGLAARILSSDLKCVLLESYLILSELQFPFL